MSEFSITKSAGYFNDNNKLNRLIESLSFSGIITLVKLNGGLETATSLTLVISTPLDATQEVELTTAVNDFSNISGAPTNTGWNTKLSLQLIISADATHDLVNECSVVHVTATNSAILTLNLLDPAGLGNNESYSYDLLAEIETGSGILLQSITTNTFNGQVTTEHGINESGLYTIVYTKYGGVIDINISVKPFKQHQQVVFPEKYIKFDGVDSYFEVPSSDLTGDLSNVLDLSANWTVSGIIREEATGASATMLNRWSNCYGIGKYSGSNIFFHAENGNGGGDYFTAKRYDDLTNERFFIVNVGTSLKCYIGTTLCYSLTHGGSNSTLVNGQLIIGLRKHYTSIMQQFDGGLGRIAILNRAITVAEMTTMLNTPGFSTLSFYSDFGAWFKIDESVYPSVNNAVTDTNYTLINGVEANFKEV